MMQPILFILTSHSELGATGQRTGFHFEEMATPYYILREAGCSIHFASPKGGTPPHDPSSMKPAGENADSVERFLKDSAAMQALAGCKRTQDVDFSRYKAIYFPGGHGAMWDLPYDKAISEQLGKAYDAGCIIGAVCHGPAGLVGARKADGTALVAGHEVNCFTNAEEIAIGKREIMPFLLESRLKELGARFSCAGNFEPHVVVSGQLITGQNPASAAGLGGAMLQALCG